MNRLLSGIKRRHNWNIKPEWISFSPGVVPALNLLIMAFTKPGDRIIIQPPVYFPFFSAVRKSRPEIGNQSACILKTEHIPWISMIWKQRLTAIPEC